MPHHFDTGTLKVIEEWKLPQRQHPSLSQVRCSHLSVKCRLGYNSRPCLLPSSHHMPKECGESGKF